MPDLYELFPSFVAKVDGIPVRIELVKPRITQERQDRLHGTIAELRVALDTEKQLKELQDVEHQPGNIIKRAIASIKRRFGRCK